MAAKNFRRRLRMRNIILTILCLAAFAPAAMAIGPVGEDADRTALSLRQDALRLDASPPAGDGPPSFVISFIPEFYYGDIGALTSDTVATGVTLSQSDGESTGFGITFLAQKIFSPAFTLSFIYQYAYTDYSGGNLFPTNAPGYSTTAQHAYSNMAGLIATINLGAFGVIEPSLLQAWDAYHGVEQVYDPAGNLLSSSPPSVADDRATSLMAWYTRPFKLSDSLTLTPYLGWRSVFVVINQNDQTNNAWAHLASGGLSLKYDSGPISLILRGGFNHRVSKSDIPGLSSRAVAPGVTHFGYHTSFARTIGTYGVAFDYAFGPGLIEISYDGFAGEDVTYHKGAAVLVFFF
jgi:hypothetical protein